MRAIACVLFTAVLLAPMSAHADDPREASRAAFRRGVSLLQRGYFVSARKEFEEAYKLFPHPSILLDLGTTRAKTGEYVQAEEDLLKFLADDGGAPTNEVQGARETLAQVRTHLGTFKLLVDPAGARAKLDDMQVLALSVGEAAPVRTSTGSHKLHVEADGHVSRDVDIEVTANDMPIVDIHLAPLAVATPSQDHTQRTIGWAAVGTGSALAAFGIFSGVYAITLADAYNTRGTADFQRDDTRVMGKTFRTLADVSIVTAIACAGLGVVLVLTSPKAPTTVGARVTASGVWLTGSF